MTKATLLSRVADSIYWMKRYTERAENAARFIDVNLHLILDLPAGLEDQWEPLVQITGDHQDFVNRYDKASRDNVIHFLTFDRENPNSILSCLRAARENARSIREIISSEMWEAINEFYLSVQGEEARQRALTSPHDFFTEIKRSSHSIEGVTNATMSHGEPWHFARMGRMLERADKTTRILDVKYFFLLPTATDVGTPTDDLHWSAVLRSASAFEMYRKRYGQISGDRIAEFLILDPEFPRSVRYCVSEADQSLHAISGTPPGSFRNEAEKSLGRLVSELAYTDMNEVVFVGLHEFLDSMQAKLNEAGSSIHRTFFALAAVPQAFGQSQQQR